MAITSFKRTAPVAPPPVVDVVEVPSSAMVPAAKAGVPDVARPQYVDGFEGEVSSSDAAKPWLSLGQRTGPLTDEHPEFVGKYVLDKVLSLGDSVPVVFLNTRKFYIEDVPYDSGEIPMRWDRVEEAKASGRPFLDTAHLTLLVQLPDSAADAFGQIESNGKHWTEAQITVKKRGYGKTYSILVRDAMGWLKGDLRSGMYNLVVEKVPGKNAYFCPALRAAGPVPPELRQAVRDRNGV